MKKKMMDQERVCSMCGDVGFSDKLFRCSNCRNRFQHSYCSNYYRENAEAIEICDWCQCDDQRNSSSSQSSSSSRPSHSGEKSIRPNYGGDAAEKATGKIPSPRTTTRRYKLLKDVMC